mgnify:CR=1 FL=1
MYTSSGTSHAPDIAFADKVADSSYRSHGHRYLRPLLGLLQAPHCALVRRQHCQTKTGEMMGRSRKKAISQHVVDAATIGLPSPIRDFLGGRLVALLIVVGFPVLYFSGVLSINWENGRPRLSINQQRAAEVTDQAVEHFESLHGESTPKSGTARLVAPDHPHAMHSPRHGFGERVAEHVSHLPSNTPAYGASGHHPGQQPLHSPLSGFPQHFDRH